MSGCDVSSAVRVQRHSRIDKRHETSMTSENSSAGTLVVVCGLPGVGKSTVAKMIVDELDGTCLRTDEIRKELFSEPQYDSEENEATYDEMFTRAEDALARGSDVVLDATFTERSKREAARDLARSNEADFRLLKVEADEEVVKDRISNRKDEVSDANFQTYLEKKRTFDDVLEDITVVDNSGDKSRTRCQVEEWIRERVNGC